VSVYPALAIGIWAAARDGDWRWLVASGTHFLLMSGFLAWVYRAARCRPLDALLAFVSLPFTIAMLSEGMRRCRDRRFEWRGTHVAIRDNAST
jgi:hypothetical protein